MPTYQRFEDLPVWKEAANLYDEVNAFISGKPPGLSRSFSDQLERAALSVSNNIAEGFERGTTNELLAFLYIARGSAGEVRSMLCLMERKKEISNLRFQISNLKASAESCSRQIRAWADNLQNSDIKGQRHLNDSVKAREKRIKEAGEFQKMIIDKLPSDHPLRKK
jgi:four helix bundle protein